MGIRRQKPFGVGKDVCTADFQAAVETVGIEFFDFHNFHGRGISMLCFVVRTPEFPSFPDRDWSWSQIEDSLPAEVVFYSDRSACSKVRPDNRWT